MLASHRILHPPLTYNEVILADSPTGFWPLNETSGTTAFDLSGNGLNGTYSGGYTLGETGIGDGETGVLFDGSTGVVSVTYAPPAFSALSAEAWVNTTNDNNTNSWLASTQAFDCQLNGVSYNTTFVIVTSVSGTIQTGRYQSINQGVWQHVVMVWNGSSMTIYVNGVGYLTSSTATGTCPISDIYIAKGAVSGPGTGYWTGEVAKAAIYDYALTATQIANHYAAA